MPTEPAQLLPWHQDLWQRLNSTRLEGRMPHALLLVGPEGLGKALFAANLANSLVCEAVQSNGMACGICRSCQLVKAGNHPDIRWVEPEEGVTTIKVDAIRTLADKSVLTAQGLGNRVFLIHPADRMNINASNALLKTLEEPVKSSLMILISSRPDRLPATIRSRCQRLTFSPPDTDSATAWLQGQLPEDDIKMLLAITGNAPLKVIAAAKDGWLENIQPMLKEFMRIADGDEEAVSVAERWYKLVDLRTLFNWIGIWITEFIRYKVSTQVPTTFLSLNQGRLKSLAQRLDLPLIYKYLDTLHELQVQLKHNLNPQMTVERLLIEWADIGRTGVR